METVTTECGIKSILGLKCAQIQTSNSSYIAEMFWLCSSVINISLWHGGLLAQRWQLARLITILTLLPESLSPFLCIITSLSSQKNKINHNLIAQSSRTHVSLRFLSFLCPPLFFTSSYSHLIVNPQLKAGPILSHRKLFTSLHYSTSVISA